MKKKYIVILILFLISVGAIVTGTLIPIQEAPEIYTIPAKLTDYEVAKTYGRTVKHSYSYDFLLENGENVHFSLGEDIDHFYRVYYVGEQKMQQPLKVGDTTEIYTDGTIYGITSGYIERDRRAAAPKGLLISGGIIMLSLTLVLSALMRGK